MANRHLTLAGFSLCKSWIFSTLLVGAMGPAAMANEAYLSGPLSAEGSVTSTVNPESESASVKIMGDAAIQMFDALASELEVKACDVGSVERFVYGSQIYCLKYKSSKVPGEYECRINIDLSLGEASSVAEPSCPSPSIIGVRN